MEKIDKHKVLAVVLIIALFAAFVSAIELLYNGIELLQYTTLYSYNKKYILGEGFSAIQKPFAIICILAAIVALLGVAAGVASFITKKPAGKIVSMVICLIALTAFLAFIISVVCKWRNYYWEEYNSYVQEKFPDFVPSSQTGATLFALYSTVLTSLIQQLIYFAIVSAAIITSFILGVKSAKAVQPIEQSAQAEEVNSQENI